MGRDRRCCRERPGKLMRRPAPSRPECFLFKVIKSSDHRESGSHRSADERKMKHKHEVRQRRLMFDAHQEIPFLHAAGRRTHDLSSEIFIKVHLFNSSFHSFDPNTPSIHKEKHTPLSLIGYFTCGCPMKRGGRKEGVSRITTGITAAMGSHVPFVLKIGCKYVYHHNQQ